MFLQRGTCKHQKCQRSTQSTSSCELVIFIDLSMCILTEAAKSFKTFLKENYAIALETCYLFTKKC